MSRSAAGISDEALVELNVERPPDPDAKGPADPETDSEGDQE